MVNKKNILICMDDFPAKRSPTSICVEAVVDKLKENYNVFCLTQRNILENSEEENEHVYVYRIYKGLWETLVSSIDTQKKIYKLVYGLNRINLRVWQVIYAIVYPIKSPFFQMRLNRKMLKICKEKNIECIISVCFPFEYVVAGSYVKNKIKKISFIPYMIDAYSCGTLPKYLSKRYSFRKKLKYERKNLEKANAVVSMESSKAFHDNYNKEIYKNIYYLNPPFLKKSEILDKEMNENKVTFIYTGYLYLPDRNPKYIIDVISELNIDLDIELIFIGNSNCQDIIEKCKRNFNGTLTYIPFVEHRKISFYLNKADFFINLGVSNSNAISGKIFEYMAYGKPIISIYFDENDATNQYLMKYPAACCINQKCKNKLEASEILREFVLKWIGRERVDYNVVKELFYTSTPDAFKDIIDKIFKEDK